METKQIFTEQLLSEIFRKDWMDDNDWDDMMSAIKQQGLISQLENSLEVGVRNGYSVEQQIEIAKLMYK